jgi:putative membrane protein insertion efficiency factor
MKRVLLAPIWFYRMVISPMLGPRCRYQPTCSDYSTQAIERYGAWAGGWVAASRLCRCHPFGPAGFDPVPEDLPAWGRWYIPWRYGHWTGRHMAVRLDHQKSPDRSTNQ